MGTGNLSFQKPAYFREMPASLHSSAHSATSSINLDGKDVCKSILCYQFVFILGKRDKVLNLFWGRHELSTQICEYKCTGGIRQESCSSLEVHKVSSWPALGLLREPCLRKHKQKLLLFYPTHFNSVLINEALLWTSSKNLSIIVP